MRAGKRRTASLAQILADLAPWALLFALFAAVGVLHVTSRVMVVDAGYRLSKLEQESRALLRESDRLRLELATLKNPTRLEALAKQRLAMAPPPAGAVLTSVPQVQARAAAALAQAHARGGAR